MELPVELEEWLDDLPLSRNISKNFVRAFSDGVLVAEIVARQFPKLVQVSESALFSCEAWVASRVCAAELS
jgi:hypothetical protein